MASNSAVSACLLAAALLCLAPAAVAGGEPPDSPGEVMAAYVAALAAGRADQARALWHPAYLADAAQLGVTYTGTLCPWDLASPLLLEPDAVSAGAWRVEVVPPVGDRGELTVTVETAAGPRRHTYGVLLYREQWRLVDHLWLASSAWPVTVTRFCRIHAEDPRLLSRAACAELDRFVEECVRRLGGDDAEVAALESVRIPYILADEETVAALTGYRTRGMANLPAGSVISSDFPHQHELAHLLVNRALGTVPLLTLPLLQEGTACLLGGRWGRGPRIILFMGWLTRELEMATVAEVLTRDGFHGAPGGTDAAYALAALVCAEVVETAGAPALLDLHRRLSGTAGELAALDAATVAAAVARACRVETDEPLVWLAAAVDRRAALWRRCGIAPTGGAAVAEGETVAVVGERLRITGQGMRWRVRLQADAEPTVVLLAAPGDTAEAGRANALYAEHRPGEVWDGSRWGLVCRRDNVGLYDYVANRLVATWVAGFSGEPPLGGRDGVLDFTVEVPPALAAVPSADLRVTLP